MSEKIKLGRPAGFFDVFERRPGAIKKNMHYCPGCGHGVLHKLIAEAIADLGITHRVVLAAPVGCAVFAYYYFKCRSIQCAHGRAPAVATGLTRSNPDDVIISYQGDGDLASIGFNHILQAANRGENMTVFFVNNAIYGMTGGQMAPTTLPGQKTQTSPLGRDVLETGYPIRVCEMISQFDAPVYVERCALTSLKNIMAARRAVRKALQNSMDKKGFSLVEFLSGCPVNLKMNAHDMSEFIETKMTKFFPLGVYLDRAAEREPIVRAEMNYDADKIKSLLYPEEIQSELGDYKVSSPVFDRECRVKISGFGGQGVLSLGYILAILGKQRNFNVSWLPSYGPEMRGGTANCSVVFSKSHIGSPEAAENCDMLVCMNQPSVEKFLPILKAGGVLVYDSSTVKLPEGAAKDHYVYGLPASDLANHLGDLRAANTVMLGAIAAVMADNFLNDADKANLDTAMIEAVREMFAKKAKAADINIEAYKTGKEKIEFKSVPKA